ncbi:MAG: hypothetical protein HUU25_04110 [Candidatus Sumerlaeia bacterium]|nr:hypothetical protein [Candidatus Sumerlaeia bacterium]
MKPQPDEYTCGPTCLHAVYGYYGDAIPLEEVIADIAPHDTEGTLGVTLAVHALRRGYRATIYTYNLQVFDPTWFEGDVPHLRRRLEAQVAAKSDPKVKLASETYLEFLDRGGQVYLQDLTPNLIRRHLKRSKPILTGLSATYLYRAMREVETGRQQLPDDVRGEVQGHFVVLCGYDLDTREVLLADPLWPNPLAASHFYSVSIDRLINSILLGILTFDANLLILEPRSVAH